MDPCQVVSTKETESDIDRACENRNLIKPNCLFIKMHFLPLSLTNMFNYTSLYKFRLSMNCTNIFSNEKKKGIIYEYSVFQFINIAIFIDTVFYILRINISFEKDNNKNNGKIINSSILSTLTMIINAV